MMPASGGGHSKKTVRAAFLDEGGVTNELERVAQPLFGVQQDRAVGEGLSLPARLRPGTSVRASGVRKRISYSGQPRLIMAQRQ